MGFWAALGSIAKGAWNVISNVAPIVSSGISTYDQIKTNQANNDTLKDNNRINELNYQLQKDNLDYQKSLQQTIFGREDNAVQRKVADLKAAGLSPTLAAGSGASAGPAISTSAPQMDKKQLKLATMAALANVQTSIANQQKARTEADIAKNELEMSRLNTKYLKSNGLSPLEVNQSWQQRLVNLLAPRIEELLTDDKKMDNAFKALSGGVPLSDALEHVSTPYSVKFEGEKVINGKGQYITSAQALLLKQKGLYPTFLRNGFTDDVLKALRMSSAQTTKVHGGSGRNF